jgi:phospholipid-binding lipoprotein MlaA
MSHRPLALAVLAVLALSACASRPEDPVAQASYDEADDPAEPANRAIFAFNQFADNHLLKPVSRAYADYMPDLARSSIHNFVTNLGEPLVFANDLLQGNVSRAAVTSGRLVVNSTVGVAGLFDPAAQWGMPYHTADFGQTLGVWGVGPGPSVQLPLLGFSNVRDTAGTVLGFVANPLGYVSGPVANDVRIAAGVFGVVDRRAEILPATDSLERSSLDYYAALRSVVAARRNALVEEGKEGAVQPGAKSETYGLE